jgi:hypothetical protein
MTPPFFLWKVEQKPVSVRLDVDMLDRLDREVSQPARSLTSRGCEIGGLLLGRVSGLTSPRVTVQEYRPIRCDHERGPLYMLSPTDMERFASATQAQAKAENGLQVVGYFRSQTRPGLNLPADEIEFLKAQFGQPYQIALLVRPQRATASTAGIFIWENGKMRATTYREFPCSRDALLPLCLPEGPESESGGDLVKNTPVQTAAKRPLEPAPAERQKLKPELAPPTPAPMLVAFRRKVAPFPAPVAAAVEERPAEEKLPENPGKAARVGRCSTRVDLRPASHRPAGGSRENREVTRS